MLFARPPPSPLASYTSSPSSSLPSPFATPAPTVPLLLPTRGTVLPSRGLANGPFAVLSDRFASPRAGGREMSTWNERERKIRATESVCGPLPPRLFSRFSGFHTCCSLYISHRVLYNCLPRLGRSHPAGLPAGGRGEDGIKWKTRKSDQPLRLSFHFWYYFAHASPDVKHLPAFKRHALRLLCSPLGGSIDRAATDRKHESFVSNTRA